VEDAVVALREGTSKIVCLKMLYKKKSRKGVIKKLEIITE